MAKLDAIEINKTNQTNIVILNVIKMISSRGFIDKNNIETKYNEIQKILNPDVDGIKSKIIYDNVVKITTDVKDVVFTIKIMYQKITTINKQDVLISFLENDNSNKIIIVEGINKKAYKQLLEYHPNTEIFWHYEFMFNLIDHKFIPEHEILHDKYLPSPVGQPDGNDEYKDHPKFEDIYLAKRKDCPKMEITDPVSRYYNLKPGQIIRIKRKTGNSGYSISYRVVINAPISKLFD
jgi:DNA-directed RNA polymerase I, II, and III subunit RPABC1